MKKHYNLLRGFVALAVVFAFSFSAKSQMSGTYSVGSGTADFLTIREACDSLTLLGVNGAVVLDIEDGTYTDTLVLDSVFGVSATNTITFQSQTADSANVTIQSGSIVFTIGVNHVAFKNLTINSTVNSTAILFTGSEDLTVDACNISSPNSFGLNAVNYSNSPFSEIKNITVTNSTVNAYNGIYIDADNIADVSIDNVDVTSVNGSIILYGDFKTSNATISNSNLVSTSSSCIDIQGYTSFVKNIMLSNLNLESRYEGIEIYSDLSVENVTIENSNLEGQFPTYYGTAIEIEGYSTRLSTVTLNNIVIDSAYEGIALYSENILKDVTATDLTINADGKGVDFQGYDGGVENLSISNSNIIVDGSNGIYIYSDDNLKNVTLNNDSVVSDSRDAIYIYGLDVDEVSIDNLYAKSDTTSSSDEGLYIYADANLTNLDITNSHIIGGRGIYIEGYQTYENIFMDNVTGHGKYTVNSWGSAYGLYLEASYGYGENLEIRNSTFLSDTSYGAYINGNDASLNQIIIDNSTFDGINYGLYMNAYAGISTAYITNSSFKALQSNNTTYGLYIYNDYSALKDIFIDSCSFQASRYGVYTEGYYNLGMENITVQNSEIKLAGNTSPRAIYAYSDAKIKGYRVTNNTINNKSTGSGNDAIYIGGYGGTSKVIVNNNNIKIEGTSATGVYLEYLKDSNKVAFNVIDTNGSNYIDYGIYLNGDYASTNGILVEGNTISSSQYGIYGEYIAGVEILNNSVLNTDYQWANNIYLYEVKPGKFNISGNELSNYDGYYGLELYYIRLDSSQKGLVSNNFFANVGYGMYIENTKNVMFANNSFTTYDDNDFIWLDEYNENLEFYNNIFQVDSANYTSDLFVFDNILQIKGMDYNVTNIDTADANYVFDDYFNIAYKHINDWNAFSGFSANSFIEQVDFVNDSTNLHVLCNNSSLIAGMPLANVTMDIDGNVRAAIPTIGADEILATSNNIFAADTMDYRAYTSVTLDAGSTSGVNTYAWNTGDISRTITVDSNGWYKVTLTDACGSYTDSVYVMVNGYASVDENVNELNVSIYPNPSTGEFTISVKDIASDNVNVSILTVAGQLIYNESFSATSAQKQVNINNQPKGVYFVQIIANDIKTIKRIIKQ